MSLFDPELAADLISLSTSVGNYWTSNPDGGMRFEIRLPPPRAVGVAGSRAAVLFSVSSGATRAAMAPAKGKGPTPQHLGREERSSDSLGGRQTGRRLTVGWMVCN